MNRVQEEKMPESYSKFLVLAKMVSDACNTVSYIQEEGLLLIRDNLDSSFQEFYHEHNLYKRDVNAPYLKEIDNEGENK